MQAALTQYLAAAQPQGQNLFDPTRITAASLLDSGTGLPVPYANTPFFASGYVPVIPGQTIYCNHPTNFSSGAPSGQALGWAFYDLLQKYVSGVAGCAANVAVATVPAGCFYLRFGGCSDNASALATSVSYAPLSTFQSFGYEDETTTLGKVGRLQRASLSRYANLVDPLGITFGYSIGKQGAAPTANSSAAVTDFFDISSLTSIIANQPLYGNVYQVIPGTNYNQIGALYDIDQNWLGELYVAFNGTDSLLAAQTVIPIPQGSGAVLCRLSFQCNAPYPFYLGDKFKVNAGNVSYPFSDVPGSAPRIFSRWAGANYICIGDSITQNGGGAAYGYQNALCSALGMTKVIDAGISGQQLIDVMTLNEYTSIVTQSSIAALGTHSLCSVFMGTNDFGNTAVPIGAVTDTTSTTFMGALDQIINTLTSWNPLM